MTANLNTHTNSSVIKKFADLYCELVSHDGYGDLRLEVRILKRGQKEIIIHCGKQYRFVVNQNDKQEKAEDIFHNLVNG